MLFKQLFSHPHPPSNTPAPALQIAQSARVPVILDAGGVDKPLGIDLLSNVTILSPNETELARLTGVGAALGDSSMCGGR